MPGCLLADVRQHSSQCADASCPCKLYLNCFEKWSREFDVDPDNPVGSWLWHRIDKGKLKCYCIVCDMPVSCHRTALRKHHNSLAHSRQVSLLGGLAPRRTVPPDVSSFCEVFEAVHNGKSIHTRGGLEVRSGLFDEKKVVHMLWCVNEALLEQQRRAVWACKVMCIMRDERHGRLHVRFRAVGDNLDLVTGYLGQSRGHSSDSLGVCEATVGIFKRFCTRFFNPPKDCALQECYDDALYQHMCRILEGVSVDSASNELTAATDMSLLPLPNACKRFAPHCKHVLRDAAHSARRLLGRLWAADEVAWGNFQFRWFCSMLSWGLPRP